MANKLILFTADFPFGSGETFLETEITYLANGFDEVLIISSNTIDKQTRSLPDNCRVQRIDLLLSQSQKLFSILHIFHPLFWKELKIIRAVYKLKVTKGIVATMFISLSKAKKVEIYSKQLIENTKLDTKIFFYSYWCDDVANGLAMLQKKYSDITTFSRIHGWDVYFEASKLNYLPYRHFITSNLKAIYAISEKGKEYTIQIWKIIDDTKIQVSRLGVSKQTQSHTKKDRFLIVSCSNVIPLKRLELLVQALAEIKDLQIKWVHFGDGTNLNNIKELAQKILVKNIDFEFKGRMSNTEVLLYYQKHQPYMFINVSSTEGVPVSIMEAMSCGIPCLATNVGGNSEIVNNENGILLSPNPDATEISEAILKFINMNESIYVTYRTNAHNTWANQYNAEKNYKDFIGQILELYQSERMKKAKIF